MTLVYIRFGHVSVLWLQSFAPTPLGGCGAWATARSIGNQSGRAGASGWHSASLTTIISRARSAKWAAFPAARRLVKGMLGSSSSCSKLYRYESCNGYRAILTMSML